MTDTIPDNFFALIREDPVAGAISTRDQTIADDEGYRRCLNIHIAEAYLICLEVNTFQKYAELCKHDYFDKGELGRFRTRKEADFLSCVLNAVTQFVFNPQGGSSNPRYNRAWKIARALEWYQLQGVKAEDLVELLEKNGGIEAAYRLKSAATARTITTKKDLIDDEHPAVQPHYAPDRVKCDLMMDPEEREEWRGVGLGSKYRITVTVLAKDSEGFPIFDQEDVDDLQS